MTLKKKIIIIEQLNVFTILFFYLVLKRKHHPARYINTSRLIDFLHANLQFIRSQSEKHFIRLKYNEFSSSYFDMKKEAGLYVNDALFEKYHLNVYVHSALNFCGDARYSLAIKKEFYNRYTQNRVKTFVFLKKISETCDQIVFLPSDLENINDLLSEKNQLAHAPEIPISYSFFLKLLDGIKILGSFVVFPLMLCLLSVFFLLKGVSFQNIPKKAYTYAIDSFGYGIQWNRPYHEFLFYNKDDFHPTKILHVFRSPLTDTRTETLFQRYHYPSTVWDKQKVPFPFFRSRILMDILLKQAVGFCFHVLKNNSKTFFLLPCIAVIKMTVEAEIFYAYYDVRVLISRDEYSPLHIIRTLVARKNRSHCVGFMHGDYTIPGIDTSVYLFLDKYGIYGKFYQNFNKAGLASIDIEIIGAGIYGLDKTFSLAQNNYFPNIYKGIKKTHKIILIVGTGIGNDIDTCFTKTLLKKYYSDALDATDEFSDYYRIIKPAGDDLSDHELDEIIQGHAKVIVDKDLWIYKLILVSDLTLVIGLTTVGLESLMAGKRVLYYDVYHYPENVYAEYSDLLVAFDYEHFLKNIRSVLLEGCYLDRETLELIQREHGYQFDGHVVERFRNMCRSLIRSRE